MSGDNSCQNLQVRFDKSVVKRYLSKSPVHWFVHSRSYYNRRRPRFLKRCNPPIITAFLAVLLIGCSRHSQTVVAPKVTDLGMVEVASGISSSHVLADGRTCVFTPTILPGGHQIQLEASISNMDAAGTKHVYSLTSYFTPDESTTFSFDSNNVINLTLHIK